MSKDFRVRGTTTLAQLGDWLRLHGVRLSLGWSNDHADGIHPDGRYVARLYSRGPTGAMEPRWVRIGPTPDSAIDAAVQEYLTRTATP